MTCAANEQNVQDRIQLRLGKPVREKERTDVFQGHRAEPVRREEPMEVGHMHPFRCFKCGGPHKARDCREPGPPPLGEASSERKQRISAMPEKKFSINLAGSPNSCVIQLGKQRYRALVDTGAEVSLVHRRVFDKLKHGYVLGKQKVNLQAVNGNKLQVDGCATIKFKLGGRKFHHTFYVVDGLNRNVILGKDWIINNKVVLYFNELCSMKIGQVYVPLEEDIHISALVRAASTVVIKPHTAVVCEAKTSGVSDWGGGGERRFSRFLPQIGVILAWNPGCSCRNRLSR